MVAKPFIKWAGGKYALADQIIEHFPSFSGKYIEPFLGGGGIFFSLYNRGLIKQAILSDLNEDLIETYLAVKEFPDLLMSAVDKLKNTKEEFLKIRAKTYEDRLNKAARFIYLNKTCFRGLWRVNQKGFFNVPYGNYDRAIYDRDNIMEANKAFDISDIKCSHYGESMDRAEDGDLVYCDPPYVPLGGYSDFVRYTSSRFEKEHHYYLKLYVDRLVKKGVIVAVSNSNVDFVRYLYQKYESHVISARREINLDPDKRDIKELLFICRG